MTIQAKVAEGLKRTDRLCDDCLSEVTGVTPRQSIKYRLSCDDLCEGPYPRYRRLRTVQTRKDHQLLGDDRHADEGGWRSGASAFRHYCISSAKCRSRWRW